jgi:excisionase family DNA binding protein
MDAIMNVAEVAIFLNCSSSTVRKLIKQGQLPALRIGNQWRVNRQALYAEIERLCDEDLVDAA